MSDTRARALTSLRVGSGLLTRSESCVRAIVGLALVAALVYVGWRVAATLAGVPIWLSWPLLAIEAWSFVALGLLALQGWRVPRPQSPPAPWGVTRAAVLVLAARSPADALERTLLGVHVLAGVDGVTVSDEYARPEVEEICRRAGARYLVVEDPLHDGLEAAGHELVLVLAAGQVPMPDLLTETAGHFVDGRVAVVQCRFEFANPAALTHTSGGRSEQDMFNVVLGPALGARGDAPWLGGGAVVRRRAFQGIDPVPASSDANRAVRATVRLLAAGWRIRFHRETMVRSVAPESLEAYLRGSSFRAFSALRVLATADSPLWARGLTLRQRLVVFAGVARYLSGVHRLAVIGLLLGVLAVGTVPLEVSVRELLAIVVPVHLLVACAGVALGRGSVAFGDRSRHALRTMGAYTAATVRAFAPFAPRRARVPASRATAPLVRVGLLVWATVALDVLLIARSVDVRVDLGLPDFEGYTLYGAIAAGALSLLLMLDTLQVLVTRRGARTFFRAPVDLEARLGEVEARVVDLTPRGARIEIPRIAHLRPVVGEVLELAIGLRGVDRSAAPVLVRGCVRSSAAGPGWLRYGLELVDLDRAEADAIATSYWVTEPYLHLRSGGSEAEEVVVEPVTQPRSTPTRMRQLVALTSVVALVFCGAAVVPADASAGFKKPKRFKVRVKVKRPRAPIPAPPVTAPPASPGSPAPAAAGLGEDDQTDTVEVEPGSGSGSTDIAEAPPSPSPSPAPAAPPPAPEPAPPTDAGAEPAVGDPAPPEEPSAAPAPAEPAIPDSPESPVTNVPAAPESSGPSDGLDTPEAAPEASLDPSADEEVVDTIVSGDELDVLVDQGQQIETIEQVEDLPSPDSGASDSIPTEPAVGESIADPVGATPGPGAASEEREASPGGGAVGELLDAIQNVLDPGGDATSDPADVGAVVDAVIGVLFGTPAPVSENEPPVESEPSAEVPVDVVIPGDGLPPAGAEHGDAEGGAGADGADQAGSDEIPPDDGGGGGEDGAYAEGFDDEFGDDLDHGQPGGAELDGSGPDPDSAGDGVGDEADAVAAGSTASTDAVAAEGGRGRSAGPLAIPAPAAAGGVMTSREATSAGARALAVPVSGSLTPTTTALARASVRALDALPDRLRVSLNARRGRLVVRVPLRLPARPACRGCVLRVELRIRTGRELIASAPSGPLVGRALRPRMLAGSFDVAVDPLRLQRYLRRHGRGFETVARLDIWLLGPDGGVVRVSRTVRIDVDPGALGGG